MAKSVNFQLCIICQVIGEDNLVEKPSSHEKLLSAIKERAKYGDVKLAELWSVLKDVPFKEIEEKVSWHRKCYQDTTHSGMLKRARERYEREVAGPDESRRKPSNSPQGLLTRSKTAPYDRVVCFFCDGEAKYQQPLHMVSTKSAGSSLEAAVKTSGDPKLLVKLSTALDGQDAHAIDVKYHKNCWAKNVTGVLRKSSITEGHGEETSEIAAKIEFVTMTETALNSGEIMNMAQLQDAFECICRENNVQSKSWNRKSIKELIQREVEGVEFHKPKRVNESERISVKRCRDSAIHLSESLNKTTACEMKTLYDAALILRKAINKSERWIFAGSLDTLSNKHCPEELHCFFRWIIQGPNNTLSDEEKCNEVRKRAMHLAQSTISMCLTERQLKNRKSQAINTTREMPQQLAVSLASHQAIRSKEIVNLLHGFGMAVEYNRLLRVESQIEKTVLQRMEKEDGMYLPPDIVKGRHVFFAIDNVDFAEDTPDGKRTLHGTAMAIYQATDLDDEQPVLRLEESTNCSRTVRELPDSFTALQECPAPSPKPIVPLHPRFGLMEEHEIPIIVSRDEFAWLFSRTFNAGRIENDEDQARVPVWSGYNSLVNKALPVTRVGAPPLVAHPPHEWNTLLTVLMQAQNISTIVVGSERKTVISLDMGLYLPSKKLQMARNDLNHLILRPGELHIVMAMLRTIGAYIDSSGIDMCWIESELYGPSTVKQILDGNHVKRGEKAHMITLQALFALYLDGFLKTLPELRQSLFAPDGTMLHCSCKSALMHILEKLTGESSSEVTRQTSSPNAEVQFKVAIVDGMAEIQSLDKPEWIKTCKHLAEHFNNRLFSKYDENQEIRLIFDRYDVPSSLKSATRTRRQGLEDPVYYRISDSTHIAKVPLKKLLSHTKTKAELTTFLAKKVKERGQVLRRQLVVAWGKECEATHKDMGHLQSDHEEADTKIILHAVDATADGATDLTIHSPDTDVLVLAIRRSSEMCLNTSFVTGRGTSHRSIKLQPIAEALGPEKTAALPAFHAITGADNTGSLSGKGKVSCWKAFLEADDSVLNALAKLGREEEPGTDIKVGIERFVCQLCLPRTDITTVKELRWFLFRKKQAESDKLPPTQAALHQAILRAHFQLLVWNKDTEPNPVLPSPSDYGWVMENAEWVPVMTTLPPAPEAVIELVKCGCSKERCSTNRCQCRRAGLLCTDLCSCSDDSECENQHDDDQYQYDEDESDEDECSDDFSVILIICDIIANWIIKVGFS
ncbi:unnamed protein product, partial [Porites lobata]